MELEFAKKTLSYWKPVLLERRSAEETAEAIITDSCPDIGEIVYTTGSVFLRGKEAAAGRLTVSVGVSASVLAAPEGRDKPELLEMYIPLSFSVEHEALTPETVYLLTAELRRLDSHLVNPRKVLVRATVDLTIRAYERTEEAHCAGLVSGGAEAHTETAALRLLTACGEKSYTVEDTVRFPQGCPPGAQVCAADVEISHTDSRLTGSRAVVKGTVRLRILYLSTEDTLVSAEVELPFSQFLEVGECAETDELLLSTCLTGAETDLEVDGGGVSVSLHLVTAAAVYGTREVRYLDDLYCLAGQEELTRAEYPYSSLLDRQYFYPAAHGVVAGPVEKVCAALAQPGETTQTRSGENVEFTIPVRVALLYEDSQGLLHSGECQVRLQCSTQAAEGCTFQVSCQPAGQPTATVTGEGANVKVSALVTVCTFASSCLSEVVGAAVEEAAAETSGPSIIIRRRRAGETLWQLAKEYRTTAAAISEANGLEGEPAEGSLLLVPRQKGQRQMGL